MPSKCLLGLSTPAVITLCLIVITPLAGAADGGGENESSRNERSTTRGSVLPFSPAIAPQARERQGTDLLSLAKAILSRLGYNVGRFDDRMTARFKAALFHYQRARRLPVTGLLDKPTRKALKIGEK